MNSNQNYSHVVSLHGGAAPIVEIMGKTTITWLELKALILYQSLVLEYLDHIENIMARLGSMGHQRFHQFTVTIKVAILDYGVVAISCENLVVTVLHLITELIVELKGLVGLHLLSLLRRIRLKLENC